MELLILHHPLDCPVVCDQAGEYELQEPSSTTVQIEEDFSFEKPLGDTLCSLPTFVLFFWTPRSLYLNLAWFWYRSSHFGYFFQKACFGLFGDGLCDAFYWYYLTAVKKIS